MYSSTAGIRNRKPPQPPPHGVPWYCRCLLISYCAPPQSLGPSHGDHLSAQQGLSWSWGSKRSVRRAHPAGRPPMTTWARRSCGAHSGRRRPNNWAFRRAGAKQRPSARSTSGARASRTARAGRRVQTTHGRLMLAFERAHLSNGVLAAAINVTMPCTHRVQGIVRANPDPRLETPAPEV